MKRLLSILLVALTSLVVFAQKDVTKFLGIPVDGTKEAMKQKLISKGYKYNKLHDRLEGEFNGSKVYIGIVTYNNKVWRIAVQDAIESSETDIKIRFNRLCRQFAKNDKYMPLSLDDNPYEISEGEDISYEMLVNNKRYEAVYLQKGESIDSTYFSSLMKEAISKKFTKQQIDNPTDYDKEAMIKEMVNVTLEYYMKKTVWFLIDSSYGDYKIVLYYDNEYNHSDGEDL